MVNVLPNPVLNKYLYLPCVWVCVGGCVCVGVVGVCRQVDPSASNFLHLILGLNLEYPFKHL